MTELRKTWKNQSPVGASRARNSTLGRPARFRDRTSVRTVVSQHWQTKYKIDHLPWRASHLFMLALSSRLLLVPLLPLPSLSPLLRL